MKGKEKFVMGCRLLTDPTGKKMGKSEGNMVALNDDPVDAYGKIMSWPDTMIMPAFETLTNLSKEELEERRAKIEAGENPMVFKREMAKRVIAWALSPEGAEQSAEHFTKVHSQGEAPEEMKELAISEPVTLIDLLVRSELVSSNTDARRQIEQGGVKVNGNVTTNVKEVIAVPEEPVVIQKGKRHFVRVCKA